MNDIRKQRLMRELLGGEESGVPPATDFLRVAGIALMLYAVLFVGS